LSGWNLSWQASWDGCAAKRFSHANFMPQKQFLTNLNPEIQEPQICGDQMHWHLLPQRESPGTVDENDAAPTCPRHEFDSAALAGSSEADETRGLRRSFRLECARCHGFALISPIPGVWITYGLPAPSNPDSEKPFP
jgi:hypothetical protein